MSSMQIVFLFDLNAFNDFLQKPREQLFKKLSHLRLSCLRLLTELSQKTSNFRWGFKFFDSCGSITQNMNKFLFTDISLENFEILENEICIRYERHLSYSEAFSSSPISVNANVIDSQTSNINKSIIAPIKILHLAISQLLSEFQWETFEIWSPSINRSKCRYTKKNFLFFFTDFKDGEDEFMKFFGIKYASSKSKFANAILPQTLRDQVLSKADIHWIWLNTSQEQRILCSSSGTLSLLSQTLHSFQGSFIPLFLFSDTFHSSEALNGNIFSGNKSLFDAYQRSHAALVPFSSLLHHCLNHPFYSDSNNKSEKAAIVFNSKNMEIPICVSKLFHENVHTKENKVRNESKTAQSRTVWSKFIVECIVPRNTCEPSFDTFICLPSDDGKHLSNKEFLQLNYTLVSEGINLIITCISNSGLKLPGVLYPIAESVALISLLEPLVSPKVQVNFDICNPAENKDQKILNVVIEEMKTDLKNHSTRNEEDSFIRTVPLKSFQIESIEPWFRPTSAVSDLASHLLEHEEMSPSLENFHKMLQSSVNRKSKLKISSEKEENPLDTLPVSECPQKEIPDITIDFTKETLISTCKETYDSAIESLNDIIDAVKKIVGLVSSFYKKNCKGTFEEEVENFMKENFFVTPKRISEKYESMQNDNSASWRIRECQMQILLTLETELLLLPPDKSNCLNAVISYLRLMSFYCGASQLNKFSSDILRENYSHNLHDILQEIGDELDIPIVVEAGSSDSPMENSSELASEFDLFGSVVSSNISARSSTSNCSRKDNNRKLVRHRSDISDTMSRQVLLPGISPRKKKKLDNQKKAVRCSPRLASRKKKEKQKASENKPRNVRRNLFPQTTPRKNNQDQPSTPKVSHVLKTNFVAETPYHKQNHSAIQRRKSFAEISSPKEVAESPKISNTAKDAARLKLLQRLKKAKSPVNSPTESGSQSFSNFISYTPESKKRLSLKLFSKLLASPTARVGVKKCTKRLFEQISPLKNSESKRAKYCKNPNQQNSEEL